MCAARCAAQLGGMRGFARLNDRNIVVTRSLAAFYLPGPRASSARVLVLGRWCRGYGLKFCVDFVGTREEVLGFASKVAAARAEMR
jgi:hypothetical protein